MDNVRCVIQKTCLIGKHTGCEWNDREGRRGVAGVAILMWVST